MSQQPDIDIESRLIDHKRQLFRRQTSQLKGLQCPDCSDGPYATGEEVWNHISSKHPRDIPTDEVGATEFRELKLQNIKALATNAHIHWETRTANWKKDIVPDTISSPARSRSFSRECVTDTKGPGNRSPKRGVLDSMEVSSPRNRAHPHAKRTRGVPKSNTRQNSVDPDFNRSLPIAKEQLDETHPPIQRRLFNPNIDDARTFNANPMQNASGESVPRSLTAQGRDIWDGPEQRIQQPQPRRPPPITIAQPGGSNLDEAPVPESPPPKGSPNPPDDESDARLAVIREPITRPISPDQLVAEVKGIYAGLIMVERKCCEVDNRQHQAALRMDDEPLNIQQWQALIALHRTLLHEHHDFLLASQHPSAAPALKCLARRYAMPARMWRHAIHSFLELLRHRLSAPMEHMLTFIYMSYSMMTLLYETVPTFRDTWIECLGDLARYRMAIEDERKKDNLRDVWKNVARQWYSMTADRTPEVGRLYHHLAILARSSILSSRLNILSELFYYCKSLSVEQPFTARESILTVFDPISQLEMIFFRNQLLGESFVQLHKMGSTQIGLERFENTLEQFISLLDKVHTEKQSGRGASRWRTQACFMAVRNTAGVFQCGSRGNILKTTCKEGRKHKNEHASAVQSSGLNSGNVGEDCVIDGSGSKSTEGAIEELERKFDREASLGYVFVPEPPRKLKQQKREPVTQFSQNTGSDITSPKLSAQINIPRDTREEGSKSKSNQASTTRESGASPENASDCEGGASVIRTLPTCRPPLGPQVSTVLPPVQMENTHSPGISIVETSLPAECSYELPRYSSHGHPRAEPPPYKRDVRQTLKSAASEFGRSFLRQFLPLAIPGVAFGRPKGELGDPSYSNQTSIDSKPSISVPEAASIIFAAAAVLIAFMALLLQFRAYRRRESNS